MKIRSFFALLLALCMLLCSCSAPKEKKEKEAAEETAADTTQEAQNEPDENAYEKVTVIESENFTVDSAMLSFMYYSNFANYIIPYAEYYGILADQPLSQQMYSDEMLWNQYLYNATETNILNIICISEHARAQGHEFPEMETYLDEQLDMWKAYAEESEVTFDEYIKMYFGENITEEDVRNAFELQFYAYSYNNILAEEAEALLTEEYYENYFAENCDETTQTQPAKNVCHILFKTDTYGSEEAAKKAAEEVYALWQEGEQTQASFEALAEEYTEDSNCLYENVPKGQMVEEFENWIYDDSRQAGDSGLVLTTYGYHIMYFAGDGIIQWREDAKESCIQSYLAEKTAEYSETFLEGIEILDNALETIPDVIPEGYKTRA